VKLSIAWRIALGFVVPLVLFGVMATTAIVQMNAMQAITKTVSDRVELSAAARDILLQLVNLEAGVRAYADTGNAKLVDDYERGSTQLAQDVDLVANATGDAKLTAVFVDAKKQIAAITKFYDSEVALVDKKKRSSTCTAIRRRTLPTKPTSSSKPRVRTARARGRSRSARWSVSEFSPSSSSCLRHSFSVAGSRVGSRAFKSHSAAS